MDIKFRLNLEFEDDEERDFRQTSRHEFYEAEDLFGGWYEPSREVHLSYAREYLVNVRPDLTSGTITIDHTASTTNTEAQPEPPRNVESFIAGRRAGRTMSNFIANLMPEPLTRGRR